MNCTISVISFLVLSLALAMTSARDTKLEAVWKGNTEFAKKLYHALSKEKGNIFFSPLSVHAVLSMLHQGSKGKTQQTLGDVLELPGLRESAKGYERVMKSLNSVKDVTLLIANKIYIQNRYAFKDNFASTISKNFLSEVQSLDFAKSKEAAKTINTWVEGKTNNRIKNLVKPQDLNEQTRLVLVNAIYFQGIWEYPFSPSMTKSHKFYINGKDSIDVQMMRLIQTLYYKEDENLDSKVLELPYRNNNLSMIIILPNKRNGIAELEEKLYTVDMSTITQHMHRPEVSVHLPKFKIEATIDLNKPLTDIGLGEIFSSSADLSGMIQSPQPLQVSKVIQKAFIEVNERGTEAAAATHNVMVSHSRPLETADFVADHSFVVLLQAKKENLKTILFQGRIVKPQ
ncbi:unnamed protein product [Callosobruchus maculatus]|uniref:Serpin domain-containing protein n=1 Tax=Callosobruchus maculatus TaxID=64391 RepID=A0A653CQ90_CALMS|nr:unnamed protein product [Callosobruchus maculatus]